VTCHPQDRYRRILLVRLAGGLALVAGVQRRVPAAPSVAASTESERRWIDAAFAMKRDAESRGDQPYGAVVVLHGAIVGEGPSRVVQRGDADAHAEREAIRDAQRRLGRTDLEGAALYSTSRPCARCARVAADARISRMVHGRELHDAGPPRA